MNPEDLKLLNKSLSESVNLFQSIHVLQSKEDELAFGNETSAGKGVSHLDPCMDYFALPGRSCKNLFHPIFFLNDMLLRKI